MPLFVTVAPGIEVDENTTIDAATLNLIAQPSVSVVGSIDGGSLTLGSGTVSTSSITDLNVTTEKLANLSVTNGKLALNAVTNDKILAGTIAADRLAVGAAVGNIVAGTITGSMMTGLTVGAAQLANDSVITAKIMDGHVSTAKIANDAVTPAKMSWKAPITQLLYTTYQSKTSTNPATALYTGEGVRGTSNIQRIPITELDTTYTTTQTNAKILYTANIYCTQNNINIAFVLIRKIGTSGWTEIGSPTVLADNDKLFGIASVPMDWDDSNNRGPRCLSFSVLDTSITAAIGTVITYNIIAYNKGGAFNLYLNGDDDGLNTRGTSRVIIQEFPA